MRSATCAEAPANTAEKPETTNERGTALKEDYNSPGVENESSRKRKCNPDNWKKTPTNPTNTTTDPSLEVFPGESVKLVQVLSVCVA